MASVTNTSAAPRSLVSLFVAALIGAAPIFALIGGAF